MSIAELPTSQLPTHLDLPYTDDIPKDDFYHPEQSYLLTSSLWPHLCRLHPNVNFFIGSDCGIYWLHNQKEPLKGCKSPDWFYVPDVPNLLDGRLRNSYVMWQEKVSPLLIVEYVSGDGSKERDETRETGRFWVYEQGIKASYYAIHDPQRCTLEVFELVRGRYQPKTPEHNGRFHIPEMRIELCIWKGEYHRNQVNWLRAWDMKGVLMPTPDEIVEQLHEEQFAREDYLRAHQRAEALAARLRELGVDPDKC